MLSPKEEARHDELLERMITDLSPMKAEDVGALLFMATTRKSRYPSMPQRDIEESEARKKLLSLPYGWELFKLERKMMGY